MYESKKSTCYIIIDKWFKVSNTNKLLFFYLKPVYNDSEARKHGRFRFHWLLKIIYWLVVSGVEYTFSTISTMTIRPRSGLLFFLKWESSVSTMSRARKLLRRRNLHRTLHKQVHLSYDSSKVQNKRMSKYLQVGQTK